MAKEQKTKYDKCTTRMKYCCEMCFHNPKCNEVAEYHEQLAEWLEELKSSRQELNELRKYSYVQGLSDGYINAIDDFVNVCEKQFTTMYGQRYVDMRDIVNIAEQLKEGRKNE